MNVMWVTESFPPSMGGVQQYLCNTIQNMAYCKSIIVTKQLAGYSSQDVDEKFRSAGHRIYRLTDWPSVLDITVVYKSLIRLLKFCGRIISISRSEAISLIVIGHVPFAFLLLLAFLKLFNKLPVVLIFHGEEVPVIPMKSNNIRRRLITLADIFVCNSRFTENILTKFCGPLTGIFIANPGVEEKFFQEIDCTLLRARMNIGKRRVIYTVGRLDLRKGHDKVIEALPKIIEQIPDIIYLIGGAGPNIDSLKKRVAEMNLTDYVRFCGFIPEEDIVAFHQLGDVFVMPNRTLDDGDTEGFGIVFLEANACGKPVIGGACGGASDAIEHGVTGFLVNPYDTDELCEKIVYLLSNPVEASKMGESGRQRAWQRFRWPILAKKLEDVLINTVHSHSS